MSAIKKTINKALFRELVPEQHIAVIERDGRIVRLAGPGYFSYNRFSEEVIALIKVGPQQPVVVELPQTRSKDGMPAACTCRLAWGLDFSRHNFKEFPNHVRNAPDIQANILAGFGAKAVRNVVGSFPAEELRLGGAPARMEEQIKAQLAPQVRFAGIALFQVTVVDIVPPAALDTMARAIQEKRLQLENETLGKQIEAKVTEIMTKTEADRRAVLAEVTAREQEIAAAQMELTYRWLAALDPALAEKITEMEAQKALAAKAGSLNLFAPLSGPWGASVLPLPAQPTLPPTNGHHHHHNGK